jgi:hypothetical protein
MIPEFISWGSSIRAARAALLPGAPFTSMRIARVWGGSVVTKFWWLSLRSGSAAIVEAESLAHARLLAVVNDMGRASHFTDGYPIDPHLLELIPEELIERKLSPAEASELLDQLRMSELEGIAPGGQTVARMDRAAIAASAPGRSP